jgi:hypothetical protein
VYRHYLCGSDGKHRCAIVQRILNTIRVSVGRFALIIDPKEMHCRPAWQMRGPIYGIKHTPMSAPSIRTIDRYPGSSAQRRTQLNRSFCLNPSFS